ncbi:MAG: site-specific integrase [Devosia sp.]
MPTRKKPPRLWLRPARHDGAAVWLIKEGSRRISTGCFQDDLEGAENALALYIATKAARAASEMRDRDPSNVPISAVLMAYNEVKKDQVKRPRLLKAQMDSLNSWWGGLMVGDVSRALCQKFVAERGGQRAAAIELAYLKAAINHAAKDRRILYSVPVWMPPKGRPRERWITRSEMARLLWQAWRYREIQKGSPGRYTRRHIAWFILMGRYTGSRSGVILNASFEPLPGRGWVDLDAGVYHRAPDGAHETNKRRPPIRLPAPLLAHLRRRRMRSELDGKPQVHVVEWNGSAVASVKKGWAATVKAAGLGSDVTPHVLRHTCATWMMMAGADKWEAAGFLGMTMQTLESVYGHMSPNHQASAHRALMAKPVAMDRPTPRLVHSDR